MTTVVELKQNVKSLHQATGDMIEKAVHSLDVRNDKEVEEEIIKKQQENPDIDFTCNSAKEIKFSQYEKTILVDTVSRHMRNSRVPWKIVASVWLTKYTAEVKAKQLNRLVMRSLDVLKTQYLNSIRQKPKKKTEKSNQSADEKEDDEKEAASSSSSSSLPSAIFNTNESRHWTTASTNYFIELYEKRGKTTWSYEYFNSNWPTDLYGACSKIRWSNKNKTLKNKRKRETDEGGSKKQKTEQTSVNSVLIS